MQTNWVGWYVLDFFAYKIILIVCPIMEEVVRMLYNEDAILPKSKEPTFSR